MICGRLVQKNGSYWTILNITGTTRCFIKNSENFLHLIKLGDLIAVTNEIPVVLTKNFHLNRSDFRIQKILDPRRQKALKIRSQIEQGIRSYFQSLGFLETRTPLLVPSPGMEPHIKPFKIAESSFFLPTSPEFAMKRLLVAGLEKIFQICPAFRDEPHSLTHSPEFTMLEWYRAYADETHIMQDTESMIESLAKQLLGGRSEIKFQGQEISVTPPWPRLRIRDLFLKEVGIDLAQMKNSTLLAHECRRLGIPASASEEWNDLYFKIWLNLIEPHLPKNQAVFVTRYPASQAALSCIDADPDGSLWSRRFEVYIGGLEIANAFQELTDPVEQRKRFEEDMKLREKTYGEDFPVTPLDEDFLDALTEGMPPSSGIALGVDRLIMLFADEPDIQYTHWLNISGS